MFFIILSLLVAFQLFHFVAGYAIAKQLGRTFYIPYNESDFRDYRVLGRMVEVTNIFPRLKPFYTVFEIKSINETMVPFAYDKNNSPSCCLYEDPMKYANHTAKYLLLDLKFAQNVRFIEPYLGEISELLTFQDDIRHRGNAIIARLRLEYAKVMCVHIRRTDFVALRLSTDPKLIIQKTREIAGRTNLSRYLLFGDDQGFMRMIAGNLEHEKNGIRHSKADISTFSESIDLYIASQVCGAFFISAATSTFGWWLAFFTPNQDSIYYMDDKRAMREKVPNKDLFLETWKPIK